MVKTMVKKSKTITTYSVPFDFPIMKDGAYRLRRDNRGNAYMEGPLVESIQWCEEALHWMRAQAKALSKDVDDSWGPLYLARVIAPKICPDKDKLTDEIRFLKNRVAQLECGIAPLIHHLQMEYSYGNKKKAGGIKPLIEIGLHALRRNRRMKKKV